MVLDWTAAAWFLPFVLPITVWVAWSDMRHMKIPNYAVIALFAAFVVLGLILSTGAVDMMIVDYQCIMPSLGTVASCYHTKMVSTSDKARFPHMDHYEFHPDNAAAKAREVVREAIANFPRRGEVYIPVEAVDSLGGFSVEAVRVADRHASASAF